MASIGRIAFLVVGLSVSAQAQPGPPPGMQPPPADPTARPAPVPDMPIVTPPPIPPVPPPIPREPPEAYFVAEQNRPVGPLTRAQLEERIRGGHLNRQSMVWKAGTPAWVKGEELAELRPLFDAVPPPPPTNHAEFMVGTWTATMQIAAGMQQTNRVEFRPDGSFSGYAMYSYGGQNMPQPLSGTYTATAAGPSTFTLTLNITGQGPTTQVFRVIDRNTIENQADRQRSTRVQ